RRREDPVRPDLPRARSPAAARAGRGGRQRPGEPGPVDSRARPAVAAGARPDRPVRNPRLRRDPRLGRGRSGAAGLSGAASHVTREALAMTYSVKEIFYTLQGEGAQAGRPAVFCRFSGCNLWSGREEDRAEAVCSFCDTDFVGTDGQGGGKFRGAAELAAAIAAQWPADDDSGD